MIIYNVTINVEDEIASAWVQWMKETHLPDVMNTGMFEYYKFMTKYIPVRRNELVRPFAVQYYASHMDKYEKYVNEFAPALKADSSNKWGDNVYCFSHLARRVGLSVIMDNKPACIDKYWSFLLLMVDKIQRYLYIFAHITKNHGLVTSTKTLSGNH
jgi:hypothetical protein